MKTILITAYAIDPYKGSEDGTGWNISYQVSKTHKTQIITRKNNRTSIEKFIQESDDPTLKNMSFHYYDLPKWAMFWKKKISSKDYVLYFYLWQLLMPLFVFKHKIKFDLAHNLNFHSDSHPTFLWLFGKPTLWGPIGHHPKIPKKYVTSEYGNMELFKDRFNFFVKTFFRRFDPFYRLAVRKCDKIIGINSSVAKVTGVSSQKFEIIPAIGSNNVHRFIEKPSNEFNILSIGRFVPMKGFDITLRSFKKLLDHSEGIQQKITLTIIGKGPYKEHIESLTKELKLKDNVNIINWLPKSELKEIYNKTHLFLFPSHEGAGMVVPEALSYSIPVVCFNNVGPGELISEKCGIRIDYSDYQDSIDQFAIKMKNLLLNETKYQKMAQEASHHFQETFLWKNKGLKILSIYDELFQESAPQTDNTTQIQLNIAHFNKS